MEQKGLNGVGPQATNIAIPGNRENEREEFTTKYDASSINKNDACRVNDDTYLTKEDLLLIEQTEPKWKKLRLGFAIGVIILLIVLLTSVVITIILADKCPTIPSLSFHQETVGYWVNIQAFKDSNGDGVGDIKGLMSGIDYIQNQLGAGYIIIDGLLKGEFTNEENKLGIVSSFDEFDPIVGKKSDLESLVKLFHKRNMKVMISMDFGSISKMSYIAKTTSNLISIDDASQNYSGRGGSPAKYTTNNRTYVNTGDESMVNLNLSSTQVLSYIKNALQVYLKMDVDGFLLKGVAFYHPEYLKGNTRLANSSNVWFDAFPSGMLYTNKSVEFVKWFTDFIKEHLTKYEKQRVIMIDPGNTGYGSANNDEIGLKYLSATNANLQLVGRQFVANRGWKAIPIDYTWSVNSFENYFKEVKSYSNNIALATGTPSDLGDMKFTSAASVLMLPGSPIVFAGTEIAVPLEISRAPPKEIYPKGKVLFPDLSSDDTTVPIQVPMPWSQTGEGFSSRNESLSKSFYDYLSSFNITDTVQLATASNRKSSRFSMFKSLIEIRKEHPSLKWGKLEKFTKHVGPNGLGQLEVFVRKAEGYPAVAVVLNDPQLGYIYHIESSSLQFGEYCEKMKVLFVYAQKSHLKVGDVLHASNIYIETGRTESVFVFLCLS